VSDLVMAEADGILLDRYGRDAVVRARELSGLGMPRGTEPWFPLSRGDLGKMDVHLYGAVELAREVRGLAERLRESRPSEWTVFGFPAAPGDPVLYKLYFSEGAGGWVHAECDLSPLPRGRRPYLWDRRDSPGLDARRWSELRGRCLDGDLTLLAGCTSDAPEKHGLHSFMRLAKRRLGQLGVSPIEPVRFAWGFVP
jgi:hypothetical protein